MNNPTSKIMCEVLTGVSELLYDKDMYLGEVYIREEIVGVYGMK